MSDPEPRASLTGMRSMTGFGRGEGHNEEMGVTVELSSVNRKQADIAVNLPRFLASLEAKVRKAILARGSRGRVSVSVKVERSPQNEASGQLSVAHALASAYLKELSLVAAQVGKELQITGGDLLRAPGVFELAQSEITPDSAWPTIESALSEALQGLITMRDQEGGHLCQDLTNRLDLIEKLVRTIQEMAPSVVAHYRSTLHQRLEQADLPLELDDERLLREIGLFAERSDISEELTRLSSHIEKFREYLSSATSVGRSLDFLSQELFREFNTIGAKANNAEIAQLVVDGKTEVEKIREQVQNVE